MLKPEKSLGDGIFVCLPQLITGLLIGKVLETYFHNHAANVIILGGVFLILAALYALKLKDHQEHGS